MPCLVVAQEEIIAYNCAHLKLFEIHEQIEANMQGLDKSEVGRGAGSDTLPER